MANPFQDQLLKAGLVSKDKVNKVNKSRHKQAKQAPKNQLMDSDERKQQIKQEAQLKLERDRELNRQRQEQADQKAIAAQIRQLIEANRISRDEGDTVYNFADGALVKRIYVNPDMHRQIVNGQLAIVRLEDKYELVPLKVAEKIRQRDSDVVIVCNERGQDSVEDDEYADFKVPDDLMW